MVYNPKYPVNLEDAIGNMEKKANSGGLGFTIDGMSPLLSMRVSTDNKKEVPHQTHFQHEQISSKHVSTDIKIEIVSHQTHFQREHISSKHVSTDIENEIVSYQMHFQHEQISVPPGSE